MLSLFGNGGPNKASGKPRQSHTAHYRNGVCLAAVRALTGAQLYLQGDMTLEQAALSVGSNINYIKAGVLLIKANDMRLIRQVVFGVEGGILAAAKSVKAQVKAIEALKTAGPAAKAAIYTATGFTNELTKLLADSSSEERTEAAHDFGRPDLLWDEMIAPLVE